MVNIQSYLLHVLPLCAHLIAPATSIANEQVFAIRDWIEVPDGTSVSPFFNPKDCTSNLPWDLLDDLSIAAGEIQAESTIQILPIVTQIIFVLSGKLEVVTKGPEDEAPKSVLVNAHEAVLNKPGSFFQLCNRGQEPCRVLYIVSPAYLFEMDEEGSVVYDDAVIVKGGWDELEQNHWQPFGLDSVEAKRTAREASYRRLALKKT
jgi:mannose-6-phosphate isomerase-like protein (cupin superfamily)